MANLSACKRQRVMISLLLMALFMNHIPELSIRIIKVLVILFCFISVWYIMNVLSGSHCMNHTAGNAAVLDEFNQVAPGIF